MNTLPPNRPALFCKGFDLPGLTGGFAQLFLNIGERRESRRGGTHPDELVGPLLAAGIVGRDTSRYDADPAFNADGRHTLALLAAHYCLPSAPLSLPAGHSPSA
ncbi:MULTISPECIES: Mu-like prophage major head subunit gpT family protein [Streptomyces]|uniref:Mu-like prophage major head subunit gpT family protein n=1 Tax=Streptomyces TaxID=1883 RepID=UPI002147219E|nr:MULTISPECIES: Mu-like prophage major head subunit gpT family protein [Streptomyces albidoflavus group]MCR0990379.1 Mu-like prophage major head subunit gpT family protein [Streptomyces albidoflavus]